jgi:hypothetical protein
MIGKKVKPLYKVLKRVRCATMHGVTPYVCCSKKAASFGIIDEKRIIEYTSKGLVENTTLVTTNGKTSVRLLDRSHRPVKGKWDNGAFMLYGKIYENTEGKFWRDFAEEVRAHNGMPTGAAGKRFVDFCHRSSASTFQAELYLCGISSRELPTEVLGSITAETLKHVLSGNFQILTVDFGGIVDREGRREMWITLDFYELKSIAKKVISEYEATRRNK